MKFLTLLRAHKATLEQRFGVTELALYGSFARDQAADDSDVDILARFNTPPTWRQYFDAHVLPGESAWATQWIWQPTRS